MKPKEFYKKHQEGKTDKERQVENNLILIAAVFITMLVLWGLISVSINLFPKSLSNIESDARAELEKGKTILIAEAPNGISIYAVKRENQVIYFSNGSMMTLDKTISIPEKPIDSQPTVAADPGQVEMNYSDTKPDQ